MAGKFIVIEGSDGSGKGTHFKLLQEWFEEQKLPVQTFDFPQYGQSSAYFVEKYLNGGYGSADEVGPFRGSIFYALDRYEAAPAIRAALDAGTHVLANRYMASNMGHQGGKITDEAKRRQYFKWNEELEFEILGIPRPDLNIVLHMPAEQAQKFVDQKAARGYLEGKTRDIHEDDLAHLKRAECTYNEICELLPGTFTRLECQRDGRILSIEEIQQQIRKLVKGAIV